MKQRPNKINKTKAMRNSAGIGFMTFQSNRKIRFIACLKHDRGEGVGVETIRGGSGVYTRRSEDVLRAWRGTWIDLHEGGREEVWDRIDERSIVSGSSGL